MSDGGNGSRSKILGAQVQVQVRRHGAAAQLQCASAMGKRQRQQHGRQGIHPPIKRLEQVSFRRVLSHVSMKSMAAILQAWFDCRISVDRGSLH